MTIFGIDISNNNGGDIDMGLVRAEGFDFVLCKVTEGDYYIDWTWPRYRDAAKAAGLLVAGYHYVRGDCDIESQTALFLEHLGDEAAMLDHEANSGDMSVFWGMCRELNTRGKTLALSYIPRWYAQKIGGDIGGVPGWVQSSYVSGGGPASALYPGDDDLRWTPFQAVVPAVLQFTDQAFVAGHSVDANAFRGTRQQFAALLNSPEGTEMQLTDVITDAYGNPVTVGEVLKWLSYHGDLTLDQIGGPDTRSDIPAQFRGWPQLGNLTLVDALAAIGQKLDIPGFGTGS